jgi:hypothetical protein
MSNATDLKSKRSIITWDLIGASDEGDIVNLSKLRPESVSVEGEFAGARIVIEGTNSINSNKMFPLNDPNGNSLIFSSGGIEGVLESSLKIRPRISGGAANTRISVNLLVSTW